MDGWEEGEGEQVSEGSGDDMNEREQESDG